MTDDDNRNMWRAIATFVVAIAAALGAVLYLKTNTYTEAGMVTAVTWQRDLVIEQLRQVEDTAVQGYQPSDAYDLVPYVYQWTTYQDIDCGKGCDMRIPVSHTENRYRFHVNRWKYDYTLRATGDFRAEREWPDFAPDTPAVLGAHREASRVETFYVAFKTDDGKAFTMSTGDVNIWRLYGVESHWTFQVNRFEEPQWNTIKAN